MMTFVIGFVHDDVLLVWFMIVGIVLFMLWRCVSQQVVTWILDLGLPPNVAEKYIKLFKEEVHNSAFIRIVSSSRQIPSE